MTYFFILGKNINLSVAEIGACFSASGKFTFLAPNVLFLETDDGFDVDLIMKQLGGTIKIGEIIGKIKNISELPDLIFEKNKNKEGKFHFGISNYAGNQEKDVKRAAMDIKKEFKKLCPVRWVTSREKILSSVVVRTNKLLENGIEICLFNNGSVGKTLAVQEFEEYEKRDLGKPSRNILRGMLPPKLAKMMINLSRFNGSCKNSNTRSMSRFWRGRAKSATDETDGVEVYDTILDPFCGTGTILIEAAALGYKNLFCSDIDAKAIEETKENLEWFIQKNNLKINYKIFISPSDKISEKIKENSVNAIVTEPYLGPLLKGNESEEKIKKIISELETIYLRSFLDWKKILQKGARVVIIFPIFNLRGRKSKLGLEEKINDLEFKKINLKTIGGLDTNELIYERPNQKVLRSIEIFISL